MKIPLELYLACLFIGQGVTFYFLWSELRWQRERLHDVTDNLNSRINGLILIAMDHGAQISVLRSMPFKPAAIWEKIDRGKSDEETERILREIQGYLERKR